jgi:predicted DNA-binding transcriptional regulator AlpA
MESCNGGNKYVKIPVLAEELGISPFTLYKQSQRDSLPGMLRIGSRVVVDREVFLDSCRPRPAVNA